MKSKEKEKRIFLLICNILLILLMITFTMLYSGKINRMQQESNRYGYTNR